MPGTFLVVAAIAALVDVVVLRSLFAAEGFTTAASLVLAKVVALLAAAGVRFVLYRAVLLGAVRRGLQARTARTPAGGSVRASIRSEEHTSELQSLMRISYAVFCLKKKNNNNKDNNKRTTI